MRITVMIILGGTLAGSLALAVSPVSAAPPQQAEARRADDSAPTVSNAALQEKTKNRNKPPVENLGALALEPTQAQDRGLRGLPNLFLMDQKRIWSSPRRIRFSDSEWLVPAGGFLAGLLVTDRSMSSHLSSDPTTIRHYKNLSNAGLAALVGGAGGMWLLSHVSHNEHWRETGFLSGEAALNSLVTVEVMKYSLRRERPFQGNGAGTFFQGGGTSFPSEHAAAAWSVAGIIAHEYPGPLPKFMAYGLASMVSLSRVQGRQHFFSDVFVGGMLGNLIARQIFTRHHDPALGGAEWRSFGEVLRGEGTLSPANQGSPYVPLDSWIYPALDRMAALGLMDSGFAGSRPWTRNECARLVSEAADRMNDEQPAGAAMENTFDLLKAEFRSELEGAAGTGNFQARVESVYARVTGISGSPLTDGYHFGQTIFNDYGRPYREGFNSVDGFSAWSAAGRWVGYVRAEYQHAPGAPPLSDAVRQTIAAVDSIPGNPPPAAPFSAVNRIRVLDAYVGLNFENWQVTFGRQSLWWGPGAGGPLMFSDNAEPINMFRINRVAPLHLPGISKLLGPMHMEVFIGQLSGQDFVRDPSGLIGSWSQPLNPQPILHGERFSFKPTKDFEFGFSATSIFAGPGLPFTPGNLLRTFKTGQTAPGSAQDSGDRRTGLDFTYRLPKLRNWLTLYANCFAEDQVVFLPTGYPERAVWSAGIYIPRFPKLSKLDLRAEAGYTDNPLGGWMSQGFYYFNFRYLNGYTNNGNLLGSWMGRQGQGAQAWLTYWLAPRSSVQSFYRHQKVSQEFIPSGGTINDGGIKASLWLRSDLNLSAMLQYEKWNFPLLSPGAQSNWTTSVGMSFSPRGWSK